MKEQDPFDTVSDEAMLKFVSSMFSELNIGLLIYRLEDRDDPRSLTLMYANPMASSYTHSDLTGLVGATICEAFPGLSETDIPDQYADVIISGKARNLGSVEYPGDGRVERGHFSVKAFPISSSMMGVVFENVTLQKQLHDLVKKQIGKGQGF